MVSAKRSASALSLRSNQELVNFMLETDDELSSDDKPLPDSSENNKKLPEPAPVPSSSSSASRFG